MSTHCLEQAGVSNVAGEDEDSDEEVDSMTQSEGVDSVDDLLQFDDACDSAGNDFVFDASNVQKIEPELVGSHSADDAKYMSSLQQAIQEAQETQQEGVNVLREISEDDAFMKEASRARTAQDALSDDKPKKKSQVTSDY